MKLWLGRLSVVRVLALVLVLVATIPVSPALATPSHPQNRPLAGPVSRFVATDSFAYSGAMQTWVVPADVSLATFVLSGAQGGVGNNSFVTAGLGGRTTATMAVTPGSTVYLFVGGAGTSSAGGWNGGGANSSGAAYGGGGGGATDLRIGGTNLSDRVLVAGGGGGAGSCNVGAADSTPGGAGGGLTGGNGTADGTCTSFVGNQPGEGGTQSAGGTNPVNSSANGALGIGGNGVAGGSGPWGGAGGGGGYYGGAGGFAGGAGGGGSAFGPLDALFETGVNSGDGSVTIQPIRPCQPGSYSATGDDRAGCTPADAGHYVDTAGATSQTECDAGYYQDETGQSSCKQADAGHYVDTSAATDQKPCDVGYYQPNMGQSSCLAADAGHYVDTGAAIDQTPCDAGYYQDQTAQTSCLPADAGHYVDSGGATGQTACDPGSYQPDSAQIECLTADIGYYVDTSGADHQSACPGGETTSGTGSTSISDCYATVLTPYQAKQAAEASLQALRPWPWRPADARLRKAIHKIDNSLVTWRWHGQDALDPLHGYRVFHAEQFAVIWLTSPLFAGNATITDAIDALVSADREIVVNAIAASSDPTALAKANKLLARADTLVGAGHNAKAIYALRRAWRAVI